MDSNNQLVSIIVPIYNSQQYLDRCLKSLTNQIYTNIEIVLVDDGSTDDSCKIYEKYALRDKRIKIVKQSNSGVSCARNQGILNAVGKYVAFCDSDDEVYPNYITDMIKGMNGINMLSFGFYIQKFSDGTVKSEQFDKQGNVDLIKDFEYFYSKGCIQNVYCKLFVLEVIKKNNITFKENVIFGEDFRFVIDYIDIEPNAYFVNKALYSYNINNNSLITRINEIKVKNYVCIYRYLWEFIQKKGICENMKQAYSEHVIGDYIGIILDIMKNKTIVDKKRLFNIIKSSRLIEVQKKEIKGNLIKRLILILDNYYIWLCISKVKKNKGRN